MITITYTETKPQRGIVFDTEKQGLSYMHLKKLYLFAKQKHNYLSEEDMVIIAMPEGGLGMEFFTASEELAHNTIDITVLERADGETIREFQNRLIQDITGEKESTNYISFPLYTKHGLENAPTIVRRLRASIGDETAQVFRLEKHQNMCMIFGATYVFKYAMDTKKAAFTITWDSEDE